MFQTMLNHHPIILHMIPDGRVAFTPTFEHGTIIDYVGDLEVVINRFGITLTDTYSKDEEKVVFGTAVDYKSSTLLLEWLKSFHLKFEMF